VNVDKEVKITFDNLEKFLGGYDVIDYDAGSDDEEF